jgi:hypothetical protein
MDENWYAVEQEIHDRITAARATARIRTLTRGLPSTAWRPYLAVIIRRAKRVWARAMDLAPAHSHGVANKRAATKRG